MCLDYFNLTFFVVKLTKGKYCWFSEEIGNLEWLVRANSPYFLL